MYYKNPARAFPAACSNKPQSEIHINFELIEESTNFS